MMPMIIIDDLRDAAMRLHLKLWQLGRTAAKLHPDDERLKHLPLIVLSIDAASAGVEKTTRYLEGVGTAPSTN